MKPFFSLIIWVNNLNIQYYRDTLESILQQTYDDYELYIMDDDGTGVAGMLAKEFFPSDDRVHVRELKNHKGGAYALNVGVHFSEGNFIVFIGCHDRLSIDTLKLLREEILRHEKTGVVYTDHDELIGMDRINPHFKENFNKALLLRSAYMGEFICIASDVCSRVGNFNEKLNAAYIYEYLLRCMYAGVDFYHIQNLLYHKRMPSGLISKELRKLNTKNFKEHMMVVQAYLNKLGIDGVVEAEPGERYWRIKYDGSDYEINQREYIFMKDEEVRLITRRAVEKMYAYIKQSDIAVVGIRFLGQAFTIDNLGFIMNVEGEVYPAFNGLRIFRESYENLSSMPRDCAMVDPGCCMIDAKIYRKLGGFNPALSGRDAMLDFCIRAREKGFRTIVIPYVSARYRVRNIISNPNSRETFLATWTDNLKLGDPFYNQNLNLGIINYRLPGDVEIENPSLEGVNLNPGLPSNEQEIARPVENITGSSEYTNHAEMPIDNTGSTTDLKT